MLIFLYMQLKSLNFYYKIYIFNYTSFIACFISVYVARAIVREVIFSGGKSVSVSHFSGQCTIFKGSQTVRHFFTKAVNVREVHPRCYSINLCTMKVDAKLRNYAISNFTNTSLTCCAGASFSEQPKSLSVKVLVKFKHLIPDLPIVGSFGEILIG